MKKIKLTHYNHGPVEVAIYDEATWYMKRRMWYCPDNTELGAFDDGDFDEHVSHIERLLEG